MKTVAAFLLCCCFALAAADTPSPAPEKDAASITVLLGGAVKSTGKQKVRPESKVWDAIEQAGGPARGYSPGKVRLTRTNADGSLRVWTLNLRSKAESTDNMTLNDGDIIYVLENIP